MDHLPGDRFRKGASAHVPDRLAGGGSLRTKPENQATFTTVSERVKTIATWIPASRQILDDFSELMTFHPAR